jgi:hypothetical protein
MIQTVIMQLSKLKPSKAQNRIIIKSDDGARFEHVMVGAGIRKLMKSLEIQGSLSERTLDQGSASSASFLMRINKMTLSGAKIPSFRAVLAMPYKPRRLPESPKSVSDRLLSLFT